MFLFTRGHTGREVNTMTKRRRIQARDLLNRLGNVDPSTLRRWYTPGAPGFCDLPRPHFLGARRVWWQDEIEAWEATHSRDTALPGPLVPAGAVTP